MTLSSYHITTHKVVQGLYFSPRSSYERASLNNFSLPDLHALDTIPSGDCIQRDLLGARFFVFFFFSFLGPSLAFQNFYAAVSMSSMGYNTLKIPFQHLTYYVKLHGTETVEVPLFTLIG